MANNDGLLTNEERNRITGLIDSINSKKLTNDTIKVEAEVTANTDKVNSTIISLNQAADNIFDKFDRGSRNVNPLDIYNTFGVNVDSVDNTNTEINQQNWNKIYDELSLLTKIVNKDPKLIGNLFKLAGNENLRIVIGDDKSKNFYREIYKNSVIAETGKIPSNEEIEAKLTKDAHGGSVTGQAIIGIGMTHGKNDDSNHLMHEYAHQIFDRYINKLLPDEYKLNKSGNITDLKTLGDYAEAIDNRLNSNKYDNETKELAVKMSSLLKNMAISMPMINTGDKKKDEYLQNPGEVFARTFANYASNFSSNQLSNTLVKSGYGEYTPKITKEIYNGFQDLFGADTNGNILNKNKEMRQLMFIKNATNGHNVAEAISNILISNANQGNQAQSVSQINGIFKKLESVGMLNNLNISPIDFNNMSNAFLVGGFDDNVKNAMLSKLDKNHSYKSDAGYNLKHITEKIKQDSFTDSDIKNLASYVENFHSNMKIAGYDSLPTESINDVISAIRIINKSSLAGEYDFSGLRSTLQGELTKRPSNINDSKDAGNGHASFEDCVKSMCDTFKSNFANAIEQTANIFKHAFERAIGTYQNLNLGGAGTALSKININAAKDIDSNEFNNAISKRAFTMLGYYKNKTEDIIPSILNQEIDTKNILTDSEKTSLITFKTRIDNILKKSKGVESYRFGDKRTYAFTENEATELTDELFNLDEFYKTNISKSGISKKNWLLGIDAQSDQKKKNLL